MPGMMTMKGRNILGIVPINGVRRAADMDSAAMARCTTRKFVHQYPNERTKPRPATIPKISTPMGFSVGLPIYVHACVMLAGRRATMPDHPPAFMTERLGRGANPSAMGRNCRTSLYIALVRPHRNV